MTDCCRELLTIVCI